MILSVFFFILLISNLFIWISLKKLFSSNEEKNYAFKSLKEDQNRLHNFIKDESSIHRKEQLEMSQALRQEVTDNIQKHNHSITLSFENLSKNQTEQFKSFEERFIGLFEYNRKTQEALRSSVESGLKNIQKDNQESLEKMRVTVDEKLQGTLEKRLSESFQQVSQRLQQVYSSLGEMKSLAHSVGDLKKVITNVKSRGVWGEFQLGNILEEILSPEQYEKNVSIKKNSRESVEYAVKLPGQGDDVCVYLPIDSKFPQEDYQKLLQAQEDSDQEMLKSASTNLESLIKKEARAIRDKYISPPHTTDFAVMFLPTEGLYAEILRKPGLADTLQRDYRVIISGPTTLAALLNSLSVGFRTLAIQKRSSDIWKLLGAIKTQFGTFSGLLDHVQKKLHDASSGLEKASSRSRIIEKRLTGVEELPPQEAKILLADTQNEE